MAGKLNGANDTRVEKRMTDGWIHRYAQTRDRDGCNGDRLNDTRVNKTEFGT